jgi:hypothetical protein
MMAKRKAITELSDSNDEADTWPGKTCSVKNDEKNVTLAKKSNDVIQKNKAKNNAHSSHSGSGTIKAGKCMEIFSGSGTLSKALRLHGMSAKQYDLLDDDSYDMSQLKTVDAILRQAMEDQTDYVHLSPPCNTYSNARYPKIRTAVAMGGTQ